MTGQFEWGIFNGRVFNKGTNSAIRIGLNQTNVIAIVANGANFDAYMNQQHIDSATDATVDQGGLAFSLKINLNLQKYYLMMQKYGYYEKYLSLTTEGMQCGDTVAKVV